jgi:nitrile hydratase
MLAGRRASVNGIHDMGGMHGFGRVEVEADEPVFHARWEARVFGMRILGMRRLLATIDARRHAIERLDPVSYLANGYYGRWLASLERELREAAVLAPGELEARLAGGVAPAAPLPALPAAPTPPLHPFLRRVEAAPAFAVGDRVRARNHQPPGHTRLPAYARSRRGVVALVHPACVFPDTNAHGRGEQPQHVYAIRFAARELWGEDAEPGAFVHLDCFETYLEPDRDA